MHETLQHFAGSMFVCTKKILDIFELMQVKNCQKSPKTANAPKLKKYSKKFQQS